MQLGKGILYVFLVTDWVPGALDVSCRVPRGGYDRLLRRDE